LNRRFSDDGITAVSLHPGEMINHSDDHDDHDDDDDCDYYLVLGVIETELWRHAGMNMMIKSHDIN
jgi:hypothetical protein